MLSRARSKTSTCRSPKLRRALNLVRVIMLQATPHAIHFKHILNVGEGQGQISIQYGARGPNITCATACTTGAHGIGEAFRIIQRGDAAGMVCGGKEAAGTPLWVVRVCALGGSY